MKAVDESFRSHFGSKLGGEGTKGPTAEHNPAQQVPLKANGVHFEDASAETVSPTQISRAPAEATTPGHHTLDRLMLSSTGMCAPATPWQ
jgi:hypothetical protein